VLRFGVTGTDTGVGKTVVASAMLALMRARGIRVVGMKPVETGVSADDPQRDAARLARSAGGNVRLADVGPVVLREPLSPLAAARRAGVSIDLTELDRAFERLCVDHDAIVVEGVGGLLSPLSPDISFDRLCERWGLDLIIVAGNRLGAINHTLLTFEVAQAAGLHVTGVVVNALDPREGGLAERTNRTILREVLGGLPVVDFPWIKDVDDLQTLAMTAESCGMPLLLSLPSQPAHA
jgi:dethiobiotin synthetase